MAINPPNITRNLTTGSTGPDVQVLQEWLKAQGYFPANQSTTTTYGPITTQAVAAWQQANGIDTKGNPGSYGPISQAFVAKQAQTQAPGGSTVTVDTSKGAGTTQGTSTGSTTTATSAADINSALKKLGLSDAQIATIPDNQKAVFAGIGDYITKQYEAGGVNSVDLQAAAEAAAADPTITARYGDSLKEGVQGFQQSLQSLQTSLTQGMSDAERLFTSDRKRLAETEAEAGRAYSGFRVQASDKLRNDETSVINSSISAAKDKLNSLSSNFESKYGSDAYKTYLGSAPSLAFTNAASGYKDSITSAPLGSVTGTDPLSQKQDVLTKEADLLSLNTSSK